MLLSSREEQVLVCPACLVEESETTMVAVANESSNEVRSPPAQRAIQAKRGAELLSERAAREQTERAESERREG
eukprot:12923259-Prorocentrum_lima.AAC.1